MEVMSPIDVGIIELNLFVCIIKFCILDSLPISNGKLPVSLLVSISKLVNEIMSPIVDGIVEYSLQSLAQK
jgi:hypothetical protein